MTVWTLAIETIATAGSVALLKNDELHTLHSLPEDARSAKTLAATIQDVWKQASRPTIGLVAVANGPGSFTGLRVGVITAKALAYAWNAHLLGVNSLDAIALQTPPVTTPPLPQALQVILDAGRQELFVARYQSLPNQTWQRTGPDALLASADFLTQLEAAAPANLLQVTGPALAKLAARLPTSVLVTDPSLWHPTAAAVGHLARQQHQAGAPNELFSLAPHYLRASYAEEKRVKG